MSKKNLLQKSAPKINMVPADQKDQASHKLSEIKDETRGE